jgi:RNA polymerase sigma factor (sigma-70 family)
MFRVCLRYINHIAEAEDTVMCGFMKAFQNMEGFKYEGEHSFFAWIRRIMVNESLMLLRKRKTNFLLSLDETLNNLPSDLELISSLNAEDINTLIMQLPVGYRTVFNLYVVEGYGHKEIAVILNISESTSRTQLAKARNKLQSQIKQNEIRYEKHTR